MAELIAVISVLVITGIIVFMTILIAVGVVAAALVVSVVACIFALIFKLAQPWVILVMVIALGIFLSGR